MICRAQSVKFPGRARQNVIFKSIALTPPKIPRMAQISVRSFFAPALIRPAAGRSRQVIAPEIQTPEFAHRATKLILFPQDFASARCCVCSPGRGTGFPTKVCFHPTFFARAQIALALFSNQDARGLSRNNSISFCFVQFAQRHAQHFAAQIFRQRAQRFIFRGCKLNSASAAHREKFCKDKTAGKILGIGLCTSDFAFPNNMKQNILEIFIFVVAVRAPAACTQINFHVAGARTFISDLQNCVAKIRAAFEAGESGMKNADNFSVRSF